MKNIAEGIKAFGNKEVLFGALNLIPASIGLIAMIPGTLGAKLIETLIKGEKFQENMYGLAYGIEAFSSKKVFLGALGLLAASAGLVAMIPGVIGGLLIGASAEFIATGLEVLGGGLEAFGTMAATGIPFIGVGLLGAFTLALIPLGYALNLAAPAIKAFGDAAATIFTSLGALDIPHLLAIGPALTMIGVGLASLGAGGVIAAIGSFLGGDPIKKIERLAASGNGLQAAATGLQGVASALTQVSTALASIDTTKLEALGGFATKMSIGTVVKGITDLITAPVKAIGSMVGGGENKENAEMIKAIHEVRDAINKLYAKDTSIHMDGKKVGTTLSQSSHKVA
jgi:hypothetical protein